MKKPVTFKQKIILILQLSALIMEASALFVFRIIENIIHGDLYQYGLRFDTAWATPYWENTYMFLTSIALTITLITISIALMLAIVREGERAAFLTFAVYFLPLIVIGLNLFSVFVSARITQVYELLFNYGLQVNSNWANPLSAYSILLVVVIGTATALTILPPLLFHYRAQVATEKPETITIIKRTTANQTTRKASAILITAGTAALLSSILLESPIPVLIGLGLLFWGILFIYIRTEEYTKKTLLGTVAYPQTITLNQIIQELHFKGNPVYLPPKYFTNPETLRAYIPQHEETVLPTPEQVQQQESQVFMNSPRGMLVTPAGSELTKLFEKTLSKNFTLVDLEYLQQNLPRLLIEDFEIVQNFEMEKETNEIRVRIEYSEKSILNAEKEGHQSILNFTLGSAIACALAKTTGKPITIDDQQTSKNRREVTIQYRIVDEEVQSKL